MKSIPLVTATIVAVGTLFAGCTAGPQIIIQNNSARGIWQDSFGLGEVPELSVVAPKISAATLRVSRLSDGRIVWQKGVAPLRDRGTGADEQESGYLLPKLAVGEYVVELLSNGQVIERLKFSITGKPVAETWETAHSRSGTTQPLQRVSELNQLDALLVLSPAQRSEIARLLTAEKAALARATSTELGTIVRKTKADIRALLTPEQQHLYDNINGRVVQAIGREHQKETRLIELNDTLGLSPEQRDKIAQLLAAEAENRAQLPQGDGRLQKIRNQTDADIRALLTPEQQQRFDNGPAPRGPGSEGLHEELLAVETFVSGYLKRCPGVISRVGQVAAIKSSRVQQIRQMNMEQESGSGLYEVRGRMGSATFKVYWEKPRGAAPYKVMKVESASGEILPLD